MLKWYKKRKYDQIVILKKLNNTYKHVVTKFVDGEQEKIDIELNDTTKTFVLTDHPVYFNKHDQLTYYLDFQENKFLNFEDIDVEYNPVTLNDVSENNIVKSIVKVFGEDINESQKLMILMSFLGGLGSGFLAYQLILRFL